MENHEENPAKAPAPVNTRMSRPGAPEGDRQAARPVCGRGGGGADTWGGGRRPAGTAREPLSRLPPGWALPQPLSICASPRTAHGAPRSPVCLLLLCFHSLHWSLAASSPHLGRHYYFANKTCPACPARWVVWRGFLRPAVLIGLRILVNCRHRGWHFLPERSLVLSLTSVLLAITVHLGVPLSRALRALSCQPKDVADREKTTMSFGGGRGQTDLAEADMSLPQSSPATC